MIRVFLAALFVVAAQPASAVCHRYSVWRYPWPQRCGVVPTTKPLRFRSEAPSTVQAVKRKSRLASLASVEVPAEMPLPTLSRADLIGGEPDETTTARLLLHHLLGTNQ